MKAINVVWQNYGRRRIYDDDDEELFFDYDENSNTSYIEAVDGKGNRKRVDIESSIFKEFWEEIKKIDFIKTVEENENYYGDDGWRLQLKIIVPNHDIVVSLWWPSKTLYEEKGMTESLKYFEFIEKLVAYAKSKKLRITGRIPASGYFMKVE